MVFRPENIQESGKLWMRATIRLVSRGSLSWGKETTGASSAIPMPSTPNSRHRRLARVGPRSGPPCFFEPPTRVGAGAFARSAQASAPSQPLAAIKSTRVSPTCVSLACGIGQRKHSMSRARRAIKINRGRSWGTPNVEADKIRHSGWYPSEESSPNNFFR